MEQVMKHYGNAILAVAVLIALAAIILLLLQSGGVVDTQFQAMIQTMLNSMNVTLAGGTPGT
jgi:hypothetical protein